jgi:hypothetical protein
MDKGKLSRMANALAAIRTQISQIETCLFAEEEPSKKTTKGERDHLRPKRVSIQAEGLFGALRASRLPFRV